MDNECHVDAIHKSPSIEERREQAEVQLVVQGMGCPNCVQRVRNGLLQVYGVLSADIDLGTGQARVLINPLLVVPEDLPMAVARAGREARHEYRAAVIG